VSKAEQPSQAGGAEAADDIAFESALKRLEELVRRLEQGNAPLDQSLAEYSEAVQLLRTCQVRLDQAQARIEVLSGIDADGNPVTRPLETAGDMSLEEKREARSSRRSAGTPPSGSAPATGNPATGNPATGNPATGNPATAATTPAKARRKSADVDDSGQLF
jgi:exodeoxyribonuclease VII small subunit